MPNKWFFKLKRREEKKRFISISQCNPMLLSLTGLIPRKTYIESQLYSMSSCMSTQKQAPLKFNETYSQVSMYRTATLVTRSEIYRINNSVGGGGTQFLHNFKKVKLNIFFYLDGERWKQGTTWSKGNLYPVEAQPPHLGVSPELPSASPLLAEGTFLLAQAHTQPFSSATTSKSQLGLHVPPVVKQHQARQSPSLTPTSSRRTCSVCSTRGGNGSSYYWAVLWHSWRKTIVPSMLCEEASYFRNWKVNGEVHPGSGNSELSQTTAESTKTRKYQSNGSHYHEILRARRVFFLIS